MKSIIRFYIIFQFIFGYNFAQTQSKADSLMELYEIGEYKDELEFLNNIIDSAEDPVDVIYYSNLIIEKAQDDKNSRILLNAYISKANAFQHKGEYLKALEVYFIALQFAESIEDNRYGGLLVSIADTYSMNGNKNNAKRYYEEGIALLRTSDDPQLLARALLNFGEEFYLDGNYEEALNYYNESSDIFNKNKNQLGLAYTLGNKGMVYAAQGKDELALDAINKAIEILQQLNHPYPIPVYLLDISALYQDNSDYVRALNYAKRSMQLADTYNFKDKISEANLRLAELYEKSGEVDLAYDHYKKHIVYRDSITNIEKIREIARISTEFEVSQKQAEVDVLNQEKKTQRIVVYATVGALVLIGLLAFGLYRRNNFIKRTNVIIEEERSRSDLLLENILPSETAKELKENSRVEARRFESVTVLFTDFAGFTLHAEHLSPEDLVSSLDFYFTKFDKLMDKHGLEKIKTLGDSYMCVAGLPFAMPDHAERAILAAMDMINFVEESKLNNPENLTRFDIRIGVNSGPVVAGVVGIKKFAYDIWGDTVNIASRMESNSEPGRLNISEDTYELVKDKFNCSYRGEVDVKNKGKMKMYFVELDSIIINNPPVAKDAVKN